jgi:hypothetical protein
MLSRRFKFKSLSTYHANSKEDTFWLLTNTHLSYIEVRSSNSEGGNYRPLWVWSSFRILSLEWRNLWFQNLICHYVIPCNETMKIRRYIEMFLSSVFQNNWHLPAIYILLQCFMLKLCWIRHLDVNKYWQVDALFTSTVSGSRKWIVTFISRSI